MATPALKIDSNLTGLRYSEEDSPKELAGSPTWVDLEPNSYSGFGASSTLLPREPINSGRQRKKGVVVDKEAAGGFNTDLTQSNLTDLLQGFFCADLRKKNEAACATVTGGATDDYTVASALGSDYRSGDLLFASGFDDAGNNGLKQCNGSTATTISVSTNLTDAATQEGILRRCGYQFSAGDLEVDASGTLPFLKSTTKDFTQLGLVPGEWIFVGGDSATDRFFRAANNGFVRVRSIETNKIYFDKSQNGPAITDDGSDNGSGGTDLAIKIFFASQLLKDESDPTLVVERTYQIERLLGAPDLDTPEDIQAEYLMGAYGSECTFNMGTADKVTVDMSFMALDHETESADDGPRSDGDTILSPGGNAFNTNSTVTFAKLALVSDSDESPSPLFAGIEEVSLTINNNLQSNKALGVTGSYAVSKGFFSVSGSITAYFSDVEAIQSVTESASATFHYHLVRDNAGISFDLPLLAMGDGSPNVELNNPVKIPLTFEAASGAQEFADYDHTLMVCFWDYLPTAAAS